MVSPTLASLLASRRALFNQAVADARHRWPSLDLAAFSQFVRETLDTLCQAVDGEDPACTAQVCEVAFELGLQLVAHGQAGPRARLPWVDAAWCTLAPALAPLLRREPQAVLGTVANAVLRMAEQPGVRVDAWIASVAAHGAHCSSVQQLRDLGALAAWRAGMAQLREPVLQQLDSLPLAVTAAIIGAPAASVDDLLARLGADRWYHPAPSAAVGHSTGAFTGFGGSFSTPPLVRATPQGFVIRSGEQHFLLLADAFGAALLPAHAEEFDAAPTGALPAATAARLAEQHLPHAAAHHQVQAVASDAGIVLFSAWSHALRVLPPQ
ncbi:hypothetical protein IAE57_18715 [Stenotrophomonas sp. S48]|uniref:hypothetical protein n=1 Tax=unclassified Stenotrophomonas TaxID=196198 RepID=UPI00190173A0|nr:MULTISPECIES: hypothetical protein [unclassified Stenotrophomonas]MBK0028197.1 hypothetical protein [Stenotrophomonas sp. S48]MBK0049710.1 hypothetical protein [Stenotrophomonas sp. S49]